MLVSLKPTSWLIKHPVIPTLESMSDKKIFELTLVGLPKSPNLKQHWAAKAKETKYWRSRVALELRSKYGPFKAKLPLVRITLIRGSHRPMDSDNLIASMKACIDGIRDAGVIVDDNPNVLREIIPFWTYAPRNSGYVKIIIEELES